MSFRFEKRSRAALEGAEREQRRSKGEQGRAPREHYKIVQRRGR